MKKAAIILAVLAAGLAFAWFRAKQSAGAVAQEAQAQLGVSSNHISELEMKLNHQEQLARSLGAQLANRVEEVNRSAAEIARLHSALGASEAETRTARVSLELAAQTRQQLETEIAALKSRAGELEQALAESTSQRNGLGDQLERLTTQRNALALQLARVRQDAANVEAKLNSRDFLRAQMAALENRRNATNRVVPLASPRFQAESASRPAPAAEVAGPLELQADGSVCPTPAR
jgi:chromosome segregation ATPase